MTFVLKGDFMNNNQINNTTNAIGNNINVNNIYNINQNNESNRQDINYIEKEVNKDNLIRAEIVKAAIPYLLTLIDFIFKMYFENNNAIDNIFLLLTKILFWILLVFSVIITLNMINNLYLIIKKASINENVIILIPFRKIILYIIELFSNTICNKIPGTIIRNSDSKLYKMIGCHCPLCSNGEKGRMFFIKENKQIKLICNENPNHIINFDPKNI